MGLAKTREDVRAVKNDGQGEVSTHHPENRVHRKQTFPIIRSFIFDYL